jgi:hypothetical protein
MILRYLLPLCCLLAFTAAGADLPSTAWSRANLLRATDQADFMSKAGLLSTNQTAIAAPHVNTDHFATNASTLALATGGTLPAMNAAGLTNLPGFTNGFTVFIRTNGTDATAVAGREDLPYATLTAANSAASAGSVFDVGPGVFYAAAAAFPSNVVVRGAGQALTRLVQTGSAGSFLTFSGTSAIGGVTVQITNTGTAAIYPINHIWGSLRVFDVSVLGKSDCIFISGGEAQTCELEVDNCYLQSGWDTLNGNGSPSNSWTVVRNTRVYIPKSEFPTAPNRNFMAGANGHRVTVLNCDINIPADSNDGSAVRGVALGNVTIIGSSIAASVPFYKTGDASPVVVGCRMRGASEAWVGDRVRTPHLNVDSIWGNGFALFSSNAAASYTPWKAVVVAGGGVGNGTYVQSWTNSVPSYAFGIGMAVYTNSTNAALQLWMASTNGLGANYNETHFITNTSTSEMLYWTDTEAVQGTWYEHVGAAPAPTVVWYQPAQTLYFKPSNGSAATLTESGTFSVAGGVSAAGTVAGAEFQSGNMQIGDWGGVSDGDGDLNLESLYGSVTLNAAVNILAAAPLISTTTVTATNGFYLPDQTHPPAVAGGGTLWNSNSVLYWVTSAKTNVVNDGR